MSNFLEKWVAENKDNERLVAEEELILDVTEAIWELMEQRGLSKTDLASALNKSKPYVSQLLNGSRNMTLRTLADIAFSLNYEPILSFVDKETHKDWKTVGSIMAVGFKRTKAAVNDATAESGGTWQTSGVIHLQSQRLKVA